jgi:hypothetical protein
VEVTAADALPTLDPAVLDVAFVAEAAPSDEERERQLQEQQQQQQQQALDQPQGAATV